MHVVLSVNSTWNIANFRLPIVRALLGRGDRVTLISPIDDAVTQLTGLGAHHVPLVMDAKGLNPLRDAALVLRLRRLFRREAPDVILTWTIKNNLFGAHAVRPLGIPVIPNVSGLGTAFLSGGVLQHVAEMLYRRAFRRLGTVFFQNDEDRDMFVERRLVCAGQTQVVPGSGIDLARFAPAEAAVGTPAFLMIARLLRDKGVHEYIDAARRLRATHPDVRFRLLGAVEAANRTAIDRPTVQGWQDEGVIDYLGTTNDVRPHIAAAHCVVLPSYREGAPRTLIEAGAIGRPVIATNVPGCRAVVEQGRTGLLCAVRSGESLAAACATFLEMSGAAQRAMGQAGRAKMVAEFDEAFVVEAYLDAIARAVG